ncbi:MAG: YihY/virulence factor BrkB family protein [Ignavibacteriales bacterium]|nr:YihY/virulence factor BrkB family protein [Ignavibacteriales bacterium]
MLFTASGLFSSLRTVLNKIFGVTKNKSALIAKLRDFGMVLLLIIFMLLSIVVLPLLNLSISKANDFEFLKVFRIEDLWNYLLSFTSLIIVFLMFFIFYYFIPYERIGKRIPLVAAFWTSILWELARRVFEFYIAHFAARINQIYGVYALLLIIAVWIYYAAVLFVIGAEIGQLYKERLVKLGKYKEPKKRKNISKDWIMSKFRKKSA